MRKIGATSAALSMGNSVEAHLVTRQLSHSVATNSQYYQAIMGDKHAAVAHASMERLREDAGSSGPSLRGLAKQVPNKTPERKRLSESGGLPMGGLVSKETQEGEDVPSNSDPATKVSDTPKSSRRRFFSESELEAVKDYFSAAIANGTTPSIAKCRAFLVRHNMARSPKTFRTKLRIYSS